MEKCLINLFEKKVKDLLKIYDLKVITVCSNTTETEFPGLFKSNVINRISG